MDAFYRFLVFLIFIPLGKTDQSSLYNLQTNFDRSWKLTTIYSNNTKAESPINSTKLVVSLNNPSASELFLQSPIFDVRPAWKFTLKMEVLVDDQLLENISCIGCFAFLEGFSPKQSTIQLGGPSVYTPERQYQVEIIPAGGTDTVLLNFWIISFKMKLELIKQKFSTFQVKAVTLTYLNCPEITRGLAVYNNTPASRSDTDPKVDQGQCVPNSEPDTSYKDLQRICTSNGTARFIGACWCKEGFEANSEFDACKACPYSYFRSVAMKTMNQTSCLPCGAQTDVVDKRTRCRCKELHFRFKNEKSDSTKNCYSYPSAVPDAVAQAQNTSAKFSWLKANSPGSYRPTDPVQYAIICLSNALVCPERAVVTTLTHIVHKLYPFTDYKFSLCSHNAVSLNNSYESTSHLPITCLERSFKTLKGYPTQVRQFTVSNVKDVYTFEWIAPIAKGSDNFHYTLKCDVGNQVTIPGSESKHIMTLPGDGKNTICKLTPVSSVGPGQTETVTFQTYEPSSGTSTAVIAGAIVAAIVVLIIIISALFFIYIRKHKAGGSIIDREELIAEAVQRLMTNRSRNIYVGASFNQVVDLNGEEPLYSEIPTDGYEYPYDKLLTLGELGEGNFAKVFKAEAWDICGSMGKSIVAVKELKAACDQTDREDFEGELLLMQELRHHPNVVRLLGICAVPHRCMIVEYLPGGDLLTFLLKSREYRKNDKDHGTAEGSFLSAEHLLTFAWQISEGMNHIAEHDIVHRDLACRNILVGYNRVCKVADLGLARQLDDQGIYKREKQAKLPVKWLPPESIRFGRSSKKSDVWSFGILLWEIITIGGVPYPEYKSKDVPQLLREGYRMPKPEHCDDEIFDLMTQCWSEAEEIRPSFLQLTKGLDKMRNGTKTYINLDNYKDDAYLPLDDADLEFIDASELANTVEHVL